MADEAATTDDTDAPATNADPAATPETGTPPVKKADDTTGTLLAGSDEPTKPKDPETGDADASKEGDADASKDGKEEAKDGAPEAYADFTYPEGFQPDKDTVEKFGALAKELNISQEHAQKLMDLASENVAQNTKAQSDAWGDIRENWVKEIKEDKEFGGNHLESTLERAKRTLRIYGSDELKEFVDSTGYGDNPHLIRMLAKIDSAIGEDKLVDGKGVVTRKSDADILYGSTKERGEV